MLSGAKFLVPRSFGDSYTVFYNPESYLSLRFYRLHRQKGDDMELAGFLNSTLMALFLETYGNKSLGLGVLDFFMADFLAMEIPIVLNERVGAAFERLAQREAASIFEELGMESAESRPRPRDDRKALDDAIFDVIGLTEDERREVYQSLVRLTRLRQRRAASV